MTARAAIPQPMADEATARLGLDVESAAVGAADLIGTTLNVRNLTWLEDDHYAVREPLRLGVRSEGWAPTMLELARLERIPVWLHTHPGGFSQFSDADDEVDRTISEELGRLTGRAVHLSVIAVGPAEDATFIARVVVNGSLADLGSVRIAGPVPAFHPVADSSDPNEAFDRQIRAYGQRGRDLLGGLTIGIIGLGGTGSPTAEQLLRLGVGEIIAVDDDIVTSTSITRGYGSGQTDINKPKVEVTVNLSERIGLGTKVTPLQLNVNDPAAMEHLTRCDLIFCCTDSHHSRVTINRLAYFYLIPVIDMGVLISTDPDGGVDGVHGRVTHIGPGAACLLCRKTIDPFIAQAEQLAPDERPTAPARATSQT